MRKKHKNLFLVMLIAVSILSQGCGQKRYENNQQAENKKAYEENFSPDTPTDLKDLEEPEELLEKQFYDYFDSYEVWYSHPEYLISDEELEEFKKMADSYQECTNVYTGTVEDMMKTISSNTDEYIKLNPDNHYINATNTDYAENLAWDDPSYFNYVLFLGRSETVLQKEIKKMINQELSSNTVEDLCRMQDLIVVIDTTTMPNLEEGKFILGEYFDTDNRIVIYLNSFLYEITESGDYILYDMASDSIPEENLEMFAQALVHELNHMREVACRDRILKGQTFNDISISNTLIESAAESALYDETGAVYDHLNSWQDGISYFFERKFENELFLLSLTDPSTIDDYYACMFNSDLNGLLRFFHLTSNADIKSFLNILKRNDACTLRNDLAFVIAGLDSNDCLYCGQAENLVGLNYRVDLLRLSLRNLIEYNMTHEDQLTPEEIMTLEKFIIYQICANSSICELDENGDFLYNEDGWFRRSYDPTLVKQVEELENLFYDYFVQRYQISNNELSELCENANVIINNMCYVARGNDFYTSYTSNSTARSLLEKFPKLKSVILGLYDVNEDSYQRLLTVS